MKKLLMSVVVSAVCLSFNANAGLEGAKKFKFVGDTQFAGLCEAIVHNDAALFKQSVAKQSGWLGASKAKTMEVLLDSNNVQCAGQGLLEFSKSRSADSVLGMIQNDDNAPKVETEKARYKFVGDANFSNFCKAAITNDVSLFKRAVVNQVGVLASSKQKVLDVVLDANNVSCSGQGLIEFSQSRQATDVLSFIQNVRS